MQNSKEITKINHFLYATSPIVISFVKVLFQSAGPEVKDEEPLRFDERLRDFDFFLAKTTYVVQSKLAVLSRLLGQEDVDAAIENISQNAEQYERLRIWRFHRKPSSERLLWSWF